MSEEEIKQHCLELQESLIQAQKAEQSLIKAQGEKERARKRLQLAKVFLS